MTTVDDVKFQERADSFFAGLHQLQEKAMEEGLRFTMGEAQPDLKSLRPNEIARSFRIGVAILKMAANVLEARAGEFANGVQMLRP